MRDFLKVVGCYNKAEFIEIFGFENCAKTPFNIFTLIVFQDTNKSNIEEKFLTSNLQSFKNNRNIRWGIVRRLLDVDVALNLFENLRNNNEYNVGESYWWEI